MSLIRPGWALEHLPTELTGEGSACVEIDWVVLLGEEKGRDLGGRTGVRGCSIGDEGGDAAVVGENGSVVAVAVLKAIAAECGADCCTGTDTVFISMSVFLFVVVEEVIVFKRQKEIRKERKTGLWPVTIECCEKRERDTFVVVVDYSVQRERDIVWLKSQKIRISVRL